MKFTTNNIHTIGYILSLSSIMLVSYSSKAEIFKWKDARGVIQYSDLAPSANPGKPASNQLKALLAAQTMCNVDENPNAVTALKMSKSRTQMASAFMPTSNNQTAKSAPQQANFAINFGTPAKSRAATPKSLTSIIQALKVNTATKPVVTTPTTTKPVVTTPTTTTPVVTTPTTTTSNMNAGTNMMPYINLALAPKAEIGSGTLNLGAANHWPSQGGGGGDVRIVCNFSHMLNDDPIVKPNQPGKSHLHTFFGNTNANAGSTNESLVASGNSTCDGGTMNRSAYWVPSVIDTRNGKPIRPAFANFYYKTGNNQVVAPPKGLRMIAGNMLASSGQNHMTNWCTNQSGSDQKYFPSCKAGEEMVSTLSFPACWDGKNLDSADHKSHMAYYVENKCPASHPVRLPDITFNIHYPVTANDDISKWRLSSDMYGTDKRGGYSMHGDWMNGWTNDPKTGKNFSQIWTEKCLQASLNCGNALLGDGRQYQF